MVPSNLNRSRISGRHGRCEKIWQRRKLSHPREACLCLFSRTARQHQHGLQLSRNSHSILPVDSKSSWVSLNSNPTFWHQADSPRCSSHLFTDTLAHHFYYHSVVMTGWASLPAELRLIIWQYAAMDYCPTPPRLSSLAAVCEEWKEHFEMRNFASITIQAYEIDKFGLIIERNRRLGHLRHLRLHINIPEYNCEQSTRPERRNSAKMHEEMFTSALFSLIDVLSILEETSRCRGPPGFTLEISASSPSDSKHFFQSYFRLSEAYDKLCRHYPEQPDLPCKQLYYKTLYENCRNWHEVEEHSFQRVHGRRPLKLRINPHASQSPRTPRVVNMVCCSHFRLTHSG